MSKALFMAGAMGAGAVAPTYVDDVFSTWLYQGNGSAQTITNGIDLAGQGGMVWVKARDYPIAHALFDTDRGATLQLQSNGTGGNNNLSPFGVTGFTSTGFSLSDNTSGSYYVNGAPGGSFAGNGTYASWTFRKAPKFFDVVTFTAQDNLNQRISHSLGVAPGCYIVKSTNASGQWYVYHRSLGRSQWLTLNTTNAAQTFTDIWGTSDPTTSDFVVSRALLDPGVTYVAYLFAHDTAVEGFIQCGSFTTDGSGAATVSLGWEPQFLIDKDTANSLDWYLFDTMRAWTVAGQPSKILSPNSSGAETSSNLQSAIRTDGFSVADRFPSSTYVYIAIRRPNKPPTTGTQVFAPQATTDAVSSTSPRVLPIPASDMWIDALRTGSSFYNAARLSGWNYLLTESNAPESTTYNWTQDTQDLLNPQASWWGSGNSQIVYHFKRAPGFFDVVAYSGTGANRTVAHNLGVAPELVITKLRSGGGINWAVYHAGIGAANYLNLNTTAGSAAGSTYWNSTAPTASVFSVGTNDATNGAYGTYIAYLFATLAGISKVGSYTGDGTVGKTIDCGFTTGARFVLIKRTNTTGDWFVWDTARGIIAGNDPHVSLNTNAAEVTGNDTIDPNTSGFNVNQRAATNVNVSGATYIFLAIA